MNAEDFKRISQLFAVAFEWIHEKLTRYYTVINYFKIVLSYLTSTAYCPHVAPSGCKTATSICAWSGSR